MSYENQHMEHPVKGGQHLVQKNVTIIWIARHTWRQILDENPFLTGWTRFNGFSVMAAFFKCHLHAGNAGLLIGYKGENGTRAASVGFRVMRQNARDLLETFRMFMRAGKLTKDDLVKCLTEPLKRKGKLGEAANYVATEITKSALVKYMETVKRQPPDSVWTSTS
jgi:hypothetical protein